MDLIADAADVEDDEILAVGIDDALELADHRRLREATIPNHESRRALLRPLPSRERATPNGQRSTIG
jgi:hypothetical protein